MSGHVIVVGSINVDFVVRADRLPRPGETVSGGRLEVHRGGKGANQAVAAARAGAKVAFVGAAGRDAYGDAAIGALRDEGIDVSGIRRTGTPTGAAIIAVGPRGENQIVVAPGANADVDVAQLTDELLHGATVLLTGFEVPPLVVLGAAKRGTDAGLQVIVNPAPARPLPGELLALDLILTPNEHELIVAIGNDDPAAALTELGGRTAGPVIVTQGAAGALLAANGRRQRFDGRPAHDVVDTTGAGDAFNGVLAAWLARGATLDEAIAAANVAGSLAIGQPGAQDGMPDRAAIEAALGD